MGGIFNGFTAYGQQGNNYSTQQPAQKTEEKVEEKTPADENDLDDDFWSTQTQDDGKGDQDNKQPGNKQNGNGNDGGSGDFDPDAFFDERVSFAMDEGGLQRALDSGDHKAVISSIRDFGRDILIEGIKLADRIAEQRAGQALEKANQSTSQALNNNATRSFLATAFGDLYKDEVSKPLVEATFQQALKKSNGDRNKAVKATKAALNRLANGVALSDNPRTNTKGNRNSGNEQQAEKTDWMRLLGDS